jgi:hypothetical protein
MDPTANHHLQHHLRGSVLAHGPRLIPGHSIPHVGYLRSQLTPAVVLTPAEHSSRAVSFRKQEILCCTLSPLTSIHSDTILYTSYFYSSRHVSDD